MAGIVVNFRLFDSKDYNFMDYGFEFLNCFCIDSGSVWLLSLMCFVVLLCLLLLGP